MTAISHAARRSNLSRMINTPGGISVERALEQAKANIEPLRAEGLNEIRRQIALLAAARPPATSADAGPALERIYQSASAIIDAAGPFDLGDVCYAATGLCDLIDADTPDQPFDWRVPTVMAGSLTVLLGMPSDATAERLKVREGVAALLSAKLGREVA